MDEEQPSRKRPFSDLDKDKAAIKGSRAPSDARLPGETYDFIQLTKSKVRSKPKRQINGFASVIASNDEQNRGEETGDQGWDPRLCELGGRELKRPKVRARAMKASNMVIGMIDMFECELGRQARLAQGVGEQGASLRELSARKASIVMLGMLGMLGDESARILLREGIG